MGNSGVILTNFNGGMDEWIQRTSGTTEHLQAVACGDGRHVAVGYNGIVVTSPDALTWTPGNIGNSDNLVDVAYGKRIFVAVSLQGNIYTSTDFGITWTESNSGVHRPLYGITFGNGTFMVVGALNTILQSDPLPLFSIYLPLMFRQ